MRKPSKQHDSRIRGIAAAIVVCCAVPSSVKDQQPVFEQDADDYKLTWDDARISERCFWRPAWNPASKGQGIYVIAIRRSRTRFSWGRRSAISARRKPRSKGCARKRSLAREESLLQHLEVEPDPEKRLELSRVDWHNRELACDRQRHSETYPVEIRERFVKEFGIPETRRAKHIE